MRPSKEPTTSPSLKPSSQPSFQPSITPSLKPSSQPSLQPSISTSPSSQPSSQPTQARSEDYILLSELKNEIIAVFKSLTKPNDDELNKVPAIPDKSVFNVERPDGAICEGNNQAISIDIDDSDGLKLTFCSLLEFDLSGSFDAEGLLNQYEDSLALSVTGDYNLIGAFTFGCEIVVTRQEESIDVNINFDPITVQLHVDGVLNTTVSFGMIEAVGSADAKLSGDFSLAYSPSNNKTETDPDYLQTSTDSSFYLKREVGYSIFGGLGIKTEIPGLEIVTGLEFGIEDTNVFDKNGAVVTLPDAQALLDSIKFSPQMAVGMLRLVDVVSQKT